MTALGRLLDSEHVWWGEVECGQWASYPAGSAMGTESFEPQVLSDFAVEHEGTAQGGLTEPRNHISKNRFIDTARLGSTAHSSGPVENIWELWLLSHGHSRGNQKS